MDTRWMPTVAGILNIIVGALSLVGGIILAFLLGIFFSTSLNNPSGQDLSALLVWLVIFSPFFITSIIAIIGGIFCLKNRIWGLALAGSICALLTVWALPLGVVSIIFVSISRTEFNPVSFYPESAYPLESPMDRPPF